MFLCEIKTWCPKERANLFFASDKAIGVAIVLTVKDIISSVPGGDDVAEIEEREEYPRPFFGYGESYLKIRLTVDRRVYSLQVLTADRLRMMVEEAVEKRKKEQVKFMLESERHAEEEEDYGDYYEY